jgi:hypothetical protein
LGSSLGEASLHGLPDTLAVGSSLGALGSSLGEASLHGLPDTLAVGSGFSALGSSFGEASLHALYHPVQRLFRPTLSLCQFFQGTGQVYQGLGKQYPQQLSPPFWLGVEETD